MFGKIIWRMFPEMEQETIIAFTIKWILNLKVSVELTMVTTKKLIREEQKKRQQILKLVDGFRV
jgi:hypothetical protein